MVGATAARAEDQFLPAPEHDRSATRSAATPSDKGGEILGASAALSLVLPKPGPANPTTLPSGFSKAAPDTIAEFRDIQKHVEALVARVSPVVVAVEVGNGSGSGVIISSDGLVLTAGHVAGAPDRSARFTFPNGKTALGKTLGVNRENDTGLMQITEHGPWAHVEVGELSSARPGDWVLALGHPGGFDLRRSLVVRLGRIIRMDSESLQTDCTISPGDSGGPLFDMYGRVIGVHSAISASLADNYHVPITAFYDGWDSLVRTPASKNLDRKPPVYVGVTGTNDVNGCRLTGVDEDGPAAKAGLKVGDLVVKVDGRDVQLYASFLRWVGEAEPGETLKLQVKRGDKVFFLDVKVEAPRRRKP